MTSFDLPFICVSAFGAVFVLLALLAAIMRIIIILFPHATESSDPAVLAAIASAVSTVYPGSRITNIEERE